MLVNDRDTASIVVVMQTGPSHAYTRMFAAHGQILQNMCTSFTMPPKQQCTISGNVVPSWRPGFHGKWYIVLVVVSVGVMRAYRAQRFGDSKACTDHFCRYFVFGKLHADTLADASVLRCMCLATAVVT